MWVRCGVGVAEGEPRDRPLAKVQSRDDGKSQMNPILKTLNLGESDIADEPGSVL